MVSIEAAESEISSLLVPGAPKALDASFPIMQLTYNILHYFLLAIVNAKTSFKMPHIQLDKTTQGPLNSSLQSFRLYLMVVISGWSVLSCHGDGSADMEAQ